jgi:hypothetical protein
MKKITDFIKEQIALTEKNVRTYVDALSAARSEIIYSEKEIALNKARLQELRDTLANIKNAK